MKKRKGFSPITVAGKQYLYCVSLTSDIIIVYNEDEQRLQIPVSLCWLGHDGRATWRGKHNSAAIGKYEISLAIKNYYATRGNREV